MSLLTVGDQFPAYSVTAVVGGDLSNVDAENPYRHFAIASSSDHPELWRVIFFWPRDSSAASHAEIAAFGRYNDKFTSRHTQVLGVSVDNKYAHFYWRVHEDELKMLPFPMLSDFNHVLSTAAGALNADGVADRATFIVDPKNEIRYVSASAGALQRNIDDILRILDDLQSIDLHGCEIQEPRLTPCHPSRLA
jgi:lipoyl-dependent peroxiredoxin subunit C